ncbi:MAG: DUF6514 family protein [Clostridiaceae bacterium]|nr:DUF6514 family protein [Clostridiaceae bacterium]
MQECMVRLRKNFVDLNGKEMKLTYGLVTKLTQIDGMKIETYGIGIYSDCEETFESEAVYDISPCIEDIELLIEKLWQFDVTPITLKDIVNDFVEN